MSMSIGAEQAQLPPRRVEIDGETFTISRAWPEKPSGGGGSAGTGVRLGVEAMSEAGSIRAGRFSDGVVDLFPPGTDPRLPRMAETVRRGEVISHRPRRRAVVRTVDPAGTVTFVKLVRPGKAQAILDGVARAGAFEGPFRTPRVLAWDEASVTLSGLSGVGLHESPLEEAQWIRAWQEVLQAWSESVSAPADAASAGAALAGDAQAGGDVPVHGAEQEIQVLRRWYEQAAPFILRRERFHRAVEAAAGVMAELPPPQLRPAHRDFHDKQVLWSAKEGPALLDVDTACLADPALDLGNLRAHATWRHRQGVWTEPQAEVVRQAVDAAADRIGVRAEAVAAYERASLLRLLCVYAFRPVYADLAAEVREELGSL